MTEVAQAVRNHIATLAGSYHDNVEATIVAYGLAARPEGAA